jgi:HEAT repeat protein
MAIGPLVNILADQDEAVRVSSLTALTLLNAPEAISYARRIVGDKSLSASERQAALLSLGHLNDVEFRKEIVKILGDNAESEKTRAAALTSLSDLGGVEALPAIVASLKEPSPILRYHAVAALGRVRGEDCSQELVRVLKDRKEADFIRIRAAWAVVECGSGEGVQALFDVAREDREFIAMHAARVLILRSIPGGREMALELRGRSHDPFVITTLDSLLQGKVPVE